MNAQRQFGIQKFNSLLSRALKVKLVRIGDRPPKEQRLVVAMKNMEKLLDVASRVKIIEPISCHPSIEGDCRMPDTLCPSKGKYHKLFRKR